jgi:hypothetical protein
MAFVDPASLDLGALFRDPGMFASRSAWSSAGFSVVERSNAGKIMVARHPSAAGLLFKKYGSDLSQKEQTRNFERRADGSRRLRAFVEDRRLQRLVVPRKWILELPRSFCRKEAAHVLVVEQIELLSDDQTKASYRRIDPQTLSDLCTVLFHYRGMDSNAKNLPFTADGHIALIDTEHWDRSTSKSYLHHVGEYLSRDRKKLAKKIFGQLEDGGRVFVGASLSDFDDEEDTSSSSSDDFDDEEDTSSSSSY